MMANKQRLIDARAGKKVFSTIAQPAEYKGVIHMVVPISEIDKLPTVDAVEVIRCKDCKYWQVSIDRLSKWCPILIDKETIEDDFCSFGERRTDG